MVGRSVYGQQIEAYVTSLSPELDVARRLREETAQMPESGMQIGPDQAAFMSMLVRLLSARRCLEIGTFTGMSALAVAAALPQDGQLVCCDISEAWTAVARRYWQQAGLESRIDLRLAPAQQTLADLLQHYGPESFDFAFIDADKTAYAEYVEACLGLLRSGGLIAIDNTLWSGRVAEPTVHDADTDALRALNLQLRDDARVESVLLTVGDGVTLLRKR